MQQFLLAIQMLTATFVVVAILVQTKGTGFGRVWGGGAGANFTRRGLEKLVFRSTFVVSGIFILVSLLQLVI